MSSFFLLFLSVCYSGFLIWVFIGWNKLKTIPLSPSNSTIAPGTTFVSVIVPVRNEAQRITVTLSDLIAQKYPSELFEIIVADDQSTDDTVSIVNRFINDSKLNVKKNIFLVNTKIGAADTILFKKNAITEGIRTSKGELIITTDADCRRTDQWLASFVRFYETNHSYMISGPVTFDSEKNWFEKIQSLELTGLVAIGAGCLEHKYPLLCNGANLAFTKEAFNKVNGYSEKSNAASGDDTQLMRKMAALDKSKIHFLKSRDAIVTTEAKASWSELFNQRKRWASKIPVHMGFLALFMGVIAYFLHLGLTIALLLSLFAFDLKWFVIPFLIKVFSEFILLNSIGSFMKKQKLLWLLLPAQFYYMVYIIVVGIASVFGKYEWKGRRI